MEIAPTTWSVFSASIAFMLGALLSIKVCKFFDTSSKRSLILYMWHTAFCLVYLVYVVNYGGDAGMYYGTSIHGHIDPTVGTGAIQYLASFFSSALGMSLLGVFLSFNLFGFVGLLAFDSSLQEAVANRGRRVRYFATLVVFLPSVSFWSSAIGKDAISFMAAGLALWAAMDPKTRNPLFVLAIALMFLVRPHVAALMVIAVAVSMAIQPKVSLLQRSLFGGLAIIAATAILPFAMDYSGLGSDAQVSDLAEYIEQRQSANLIGGGAIDISAMSLPMQLFTYLFRPLPFEAHNIPALAASMDNVVLLVLVLIGGWSMIMRRRRSRAGNRVFLWVYSLGAWFLLAVTTANLGISVRQKWMFAPMLILLFISAIGRARKSVPKVFRKEMVTRIEMR